MGDMYPPSSATVRRAKACNTCRRKKTKCDGRRPICSQCHSFGLSCTFQDVQKQPNRSSRAYVEELEKYVQNLEARLQHQRSLQDSDEDSTHMDGSHGSPDTPSTVDEPVAPQAEAENSQLDNTGASEKDSYIINTHDGKMRFFGASSGISIASSHNTKWLEGQARTGSRRLAGQRHEHRWQLGSWFPRILQDNFERRTFQPLPSKMDTLQLVGEAFSILNRTIPLFNESTFMSLVQRQYSWNPDESPSWWASLNVVLAFGYRQRSENSDGGEDLQRSLGHIKNALNVVVELFMRTADILAAQGLLGLALFFQNTPNPQPLFMFAGAAMRLSQSMGLHKANAFGSSPAEVEERRRTFWVAFILDADISLRTGRPSVQDVKDFDVPLPLKIPRDEIGVMILDGVRIDYFHILARFALVQRQVHRHLYTTAALRKSGMDLVKEITHCKGVLLEWAKSLPEEFSPQRAFAARRHNLLPHVLRLHLAYHCCFANLYHMCTLAQQSIDQQSQTIPDIGRLSAEIADCTVVSLRSARSAVDLIDHISAYGDFFPWSTLYFPVAGSVALSSQILLNSNYPEARTDLDMVRKTIRFLSRISSQEPGTYVDFLLSVCSELESAASQAMDQARHQLHSHWPASGMESMGSSRNHVSQNCDPPTITLASDLTMTSMPPSFTPFWNWQDAMSGIIPPFEFGSGPISTDSMPGSLGLPGDLELDHIP